MLVYFIYLFITFRSLLVLHNMFFSSKVIKVIQLEGPQALPEVLQYATAAICAAKEQ